MNGRGDIGYDATDHSFLNTAKTVREGGTWIVLGVEKAGKRSLGKTAVIVDRNRS
jgi:hypothetical protein